MFWSFLTHSLPQVEDLWSEEKKHVMTWRFITQGMTRGVIPLGHVTEKFGNWSLSRVIWWESLRERRKPLGPWIAKTLIFKFVVVNCPSFWIVFSVLPLSLWIFVKFLVFPFLCFLLHYFHPKYEFMRPAIWTLKSSSKRHVATENVNINCSTKQSIIISS